MFELLMQFQNTNKFCVRLLGLTLVIFAAFLWPAGSAFANGGCSTTQAGNWSDPDTWTSCDGDTPASTENVYIYHSVVLTTSVAANNITFSSVGAIDTVTYTLTVNGDAIMASTFASITGNGALSLSGTSGRTFTVADGSTLSIDVPISGNVAITKAGIGTLYFSKANTYQGLTTVSAGTLRIGHATGLGSAAAGTTVANGATLALSDGITVTGEALSLTGPGVSNSGALLNYSGNNTFAGNITLAGNANLGVTNYKDRLTLSGVISGASFGFTKVGSGEALVTGANTYGSTTTVTEGALIVGHNTGLGSNAVGTVVTGGVLGLLGNITIANEPLSLGSSTGIVNYSGSNSYNGPITLSGTASVVAKDTNGVGSTLSLVNTIMSISAQPLLVANDTNSMVILTTANPNLESQVVVNSGTLRITNSGALGTTAQGVEVKHGATLELGNGVHVGSEPLVLAGTLRGLAGSSSYAGNIMLQGDSYSRPSMDAGTGSQLVVSGVIEGHGYLDKTGLGTLRIAGSSANTYNETGVVTVLGGLLELGKSANTTAIRGHLTVMTGTVRLLNSNQLNHMTPGPGVELRVGTLLDLNGYDEAVGTLFLVGASVETGSGILSVSNSILLNMPGSIPVVGVAYTSTINGKLNLTSVTAIGVMALSPNPPNADGERVPELVINADISGTGGLSFLMGTTRLAGTGNNTYAGTTALLSGGTYVIAAKSFALGSSVGETIITDGAVLELRNGIDLGLEPISLLGSNARIYSRMGENIARGPVTLAVYPTIRVDADSKLILEGPITGDGGIVKTGPGVLVYGGTVANTYSGNTTVVSGTLELAKPQNVLALSGALLIDASKASANDLVIVRMTSGDNQINPPTPISLKGQNARMDLNGFSNTINTLGFEDGGTLQTGSGTVTLSGHVNVTSPTETAYMTGNVNLGLADRIFTLAEGDAEIELYVSANISGGNKLIKTGDGRMRLSGNNTYTGVTEVKYGVLEVGHSNGLGSILGGTVVDTPAALVLEGGIAVGEEPLAVAGTGNVYGGALMSVNGNNSFAGPILLLNNSQFRAEEDSTLALLGVISDGDGNQHGFVIDNDEGALIALSGHNNFEGLVSVVGGTLRILHSHALGTTAAGTVVHDGATLEIRNNISVGAEVLWLAGEGVNGVGALRSIDGNNTIAGAITLVDHASIAVNLNRLTLSGAIGGLFDMTKVGNGTLQFSGNQNNTYEGDTIVGAGRLELAKSNSAYAMGGNLVVGLDVNPGPVEVRWLASQQFSTLTYVTLKAGTLLNLNGFEQHVGKMTMLDDSEVETGSGKLILNGPVIVETVSGTAAIAGMLDLGGGERDFEVSNGSQADLVVGAKITGEGAIVKLGPGMMVLEAENDFDGTVYVDEGELQLTGAVLGEVVLEDDGTFSGTGIVGGKLSGSGTIRPGTSPGTIYVDVLDVVDPATLEFEIGGEKWVDRIMVNETVALGNSTLVIQPTHTPALGDSFTLIVNKGDAPVTGTFRNLTEGTTFVVGQTLYMVSYVGGDGNDVVITAVAPEIKVEGNGHSITSGQTVPSLTDGTAFGDVAVGQSVAYTFTIVNEGTSALHLTGTPIVSLSNSTGAFSVVQPQAASVAPGHQVSFQVSFAPTVPGVVGATVVIGNDDADENPFTFAIGAQGVVDYALTVATTGNGSGTVSSTPAGIDCGADCTEAYFYNTAVTLTPVAAVDSNFAGWSGACSGTGACVVTMDAAKNVTASFVLQQHALGVSKVGNGSGTVSSDPAGINCGGDCDELYNHGTSVTLTPAPAGNSVFTGWSGACVGTDACVVTMDAAKKAEATFALKQYALNVIKTGNGAGTVASVAGDIECGDTCSNTYDHATPVSLVATAATGSSFTGWSGACSGMGACTVTVDQVRDVTASFVLQGQVLSVTRLGDGNGNVTSSPAGIDCGADCSKGYDFGTVVTLTATPTDGAAFVGWSGACEGLDVCVVTMDAAKSVAASFTMNTYTLAVSKAGDGEGTVTANVPGIDCGDECSTTVANGATVVLTAVPAAGSEFAGWSGACSGTGSCVVVVGGDVDVVAAFTLQPVPQIASTSLYQVGRKLEFSVVLNLESMNTCMWDFGDGNTGPCFSEVSAAEAEAVESIAVRGAHSYRQAGQYTITVTASNDAETEVVSMTIELSEILFMMGLQR